MEFIRVAVDIAGRVSLAYQVGIVVVNPAGVVGKFVFELCVAFHAIVRPVDVGAYQGPASTDAGCLQSRLHINLGLFHRCDAVKNLVRPIGEVF